MTRKGREVPADQALTACIITLGCPKNEADSEAFAGCLTAAGYGLTASPEEAGLLILNTCAFIAPAVEESMDALAEALEWRGSVRGRRLVLAGCLPGRFEDDGSGGLDGIDRVIGPADVSGLMKFLASSRRSLPVQVEPGVHRYLKIAEGCSNRCGYCTIPLIRGPMVPRPVDELYAEAESMAEAGAMEIGLVAQDSGSWQWKGMNVTGLLAELASRLSGIWLRLYYLHPSHFPDGLLELMESEPRITPYIELPIQHASDRVLQRMGRRYGLADLERIFRRVEACSRTVAVRTTVITGYPGETDEDFARLTGFLGGHPCVRTLCAFPYWPEEGTPEYLATGPGGAPEPSLVQSRLAVLGGVSERLLDGWAGRLEGSCIDVLTDDLEKGHSIYDAPLVDGACLFQIPVTPGRVYRCRVDECLGADMMVSIEGDPNGIGDVGTSCLSSGDNRPAHRCGQGPADRT